MNEQDILISQAAQEYERDGLVSTSTHATMAAIGMDANKIIEDIEESA